jgi:enoyl-CoA hydratase/carnithine racemase
MTGRIFDAQEALRGELVRSVHAPGELMDAARGLAREIADNTSAVSIAMTRAMLWRNPSYDHPMGAHKVDSRAIYRLSKMADAQEGVQSFLEKRPADFPLRVSSDMPDFYPWWEDPSYS